MLIVDRVELLQVGAYHLDLSLDELRKFLLCRQDDLLVFGCLLQPSQARLRLVEHPHGNELGARDAELRIGPIEDVVDQLSEEIGARGWRAFDQRSLASVFAIERIFSTQRKPCAGQ